MAAFNNRFAFIHVPKTGGTWVVQAMRNAGIDFLEMGEGPTVHVPYDEFPESLFRFGFVRHPETWYRSHWSHKKRLGDYQDPLHPFDKAIKETETFEEFVEQATREAPGYLSSLYEYLLGPPGAIDFIGRYESLEDDLVKALGLAGVEFDEEALRSTPPLNVG
jgi:hypothetical protein